MQALKRLMNYGLNNPKFQLINYVPICRQFGIFNNFNCVKENSILKTYSPIICQTNGMKIKGALKLRCKNCFFFYIDGTKHVFCNKHGRHKARHPRKRPENTYICTHATQGKYRPW